jgi:hypothetical protein
MLDNTYWDLSTLKTNPYITYNNGVYTVNKSGTYLVTYNVAFAINGYYNRASWVYKNVDKSKRYGYNFFKALVDDYTAMNGSFTIEMAAGDYIAIYVWQSSGYTLSMQSWGYSFSVTYL